MAALPFHKYLLEPQIRAAQPLSHSLAAAECISNHVGSLSRLPVLMWRPFQLSLPAHFCQYCNSTDCSHHLCPKTLHEGIGLRQVMPAQPLDHVDYTALSTLLKRPFLNSHDKGPSAVPSLLSPRLRVAPGWQPLGPPAAWCGDGGRPGQAKHDE